MGTDKNSDGDCHSRETEEKAGARGIQKLKSIGLCD